MFLKHKFSISNNEITMNGFGKRKLDSVSPSLKTRSCLTNMLYFWKKIDEGSPVDVIYLDFQETFDKVPHQRLLLKLKTHDIGDGTIDRTEQWLTDRKQRVVADGEVSK